MNEDTEIREARLEEYRALRAEVIALLDRQGHNANLAWTGTIALLGVAAAAKIPELSILSVAFLATLWLGHLHLSAGIRRIGRYIATDIEPNVPGLKWETAFHRYYAKGPATQPLLGRLRIALSTNYGMFGITAILISTAMVYSNRPIEQPGLTIDLILSGLATLWFLRILFRAAAHPLRRSIGADNAPSHNQPYDNTDAGDE